MFLFFYKSLLNLPTSKSLNYFNNFGSLLGVWMLLQVLSGVILVFYYSPSAEAFSVVNFIMAEVAFGWLVRLAHANGASLIFFFLFLHVWKNLLVGGQVLSKSWISGFVMLLVLMGVGFVGYSLVYSQMSYWAIVVISSLLTIVPKLGEAVLLWVWGGFSVGAGTLKLFFVLHFLLPLVVLVLVLVHLEMLHHTGSSSGLGYKGEVCKISFSPYYSSKDFLSLSWVGFLVVAFLILPFSLSEPELFEAVNSLSSPVHITPEWYFCTFYGVLRSVPSKVVGVLAMVAVLVELVSLAAFPSLNPQKKLFSNLVVGVYVSFFILLMWLGQVPASEPYIALSLVSTVGLVVATSAAAHLQF